jgi:hypothetical protein
MKKVIFKFMSIAMIISLVMTSCKKDENDNDEEGFSLKGKMYAAVAYKIGEISNNSFLRVPDCNIYSVYEFVSATEFELSNREEAPDNNSKTVVKTGTYTLNYPKLTLVSDGNTVEITFINESSFKTHFEGTIPKTLKYELQ